MFDGELMTISYLYWLAAGLLLAAAEMIVPGFILMWFGIAALVVGFITLGFPDMGWPAQLGIFAVLTTALMAFWWSYQKNRPKSDQISAFNHRANSLIGKTITLTDAIRHGQGKSFIGDTLWQIVGQDAAKGSQVRIVSVRDDNVLSVEFLAGPSLAGAVADEAHQPRKDALAMGADSIKQITDPTA
jgi:inner membrane protein